MRKTIRLWLLLVLAISFSAYFFYQTSKPYRITSDNEIIIRPLEQQQRYCFKLASDQQIKDIESGKLNMLPCVAMSEKSFYSFKAKLDKYFENEKNITVKEMDRLFSSN
ncbi:hypothetical protein CORI_a006 (plasmid) [Campylobacter sp. CCUG 57310]|nr:hypothetical protein CORI_a006 [Campylobacter sp. CCUG 57310]